MLVRAAPTLLNAVDVCVWYNVRKSGCAQGDSLISNNPKLVIYTDIYACLV